MYKYFELSLSGTKKSLEGTAASVIVQLMFVILAYCIGESMCVFMWVFVYACACVYVSGRACVCVLVCVFIA